MDWFNNLTAFEEMRESDVAVKILQLIRQVTNENFRVMDMGKGDYKIIINTDYYPCELNLKWRAEESAFEVIDAAMIDESQINVDERFSESFRPEFRYACICDATMIDDAHLDVLEEPDNAIILEDFMPDYRYSMIWSEENFKYMIANAIGCAETQYRYLFDCDSDPVYSCGEG